MCPKRSDYTDMYWIFSISHNVLISQRLTRNADGSDKALYERWLKELAMLLHLNEQIITRLHKAQGHAPLMDYIYITASLNETMF